MTGSYTGKCTCVPFIPSLLLSPYMTMAYISTRWACLGVQFLSVGKNKDNVSGESNTRPEMNLRSDLHS